MQFKRYEVANMQEAMLRIRKDLGPDAIILSTKKLAGATPRIEVMAARDDRAERPVSSSTLIPQKEERPAEWVSSLKQEFLELKSHLDQLTQKLSYQKDLIDLKETMDIMFDHAAVQYPAHLRDIYATLISNGVSRHKAVRLIETVKNDFPGDQRDTYEKGITLTEKLIARSFVKDTRRERRIMALIGPTGVGKTTTLAKLAAHYSLAKKMKVGLVTTDTYRIAASEQLKIYAQIMGLPIHVASEKNAFQRSLTAFAEKDIILVDTPGRNPHDDQSLQALKSVLDANVETVLLLSPVANREYLLETADRFAMLNYDRIILTKVDECNHFGPLYNVIHDLGKPVSYMTTGQNVPRDIEKANPERLAKLILQSRLN
jgi:flagellar biosynthesis protein FlhF